MDKVKIARSWYDKGARAYEHDRPMIRDHTGEFLPVFSVHVLAVWYELRRYQDEQRKKGVPITAKEFYNTSPGDYSLKDISFEFRLGGMSGNGLPYINCFKSYKYPAIACHARFTNFRWREGYPKGGSHE
jgi:hypothetical protein